MSHKRTGHALCTEILSKLCLQKLDSGCTEWPAKFKTRTVQFDLELIYHKLIFFNSCAHHRDTYLGLLCVTQANRASTALCLSLSSSMLRFLRRYLCRKRNGLGGRWRRTVDWKNSRILGTSVVLVSLCFCFTFKAATRARICTSRTVQVCHWKVIFPARCFVTGWRWVGNACLDVVFYYACEEKRL